MHGDHGFGRLDQHAVAIHHQGARVLLLLDSGEHIVLSLAEARLIIEQTRKNIVGWVATYDGARLVLVEEVAP